MISGCSRLIPMTQTEWWNQTSCTSSPSHCFCDSQWWFFQSSLVLWHSLSFPSLNIMSKRIRESDKELEEVTSMATFQASRTGMSSVISLFQTLWMPPFPSHLKSYLWVFVKIIHRERISVDTLWGKGLSRRTRFSRKGPTVLAPPLSSFLFCHSLWFLSSSYSFFFSKNSFLKGNQWLTPFSLDISFWTSSSSSSLTISTHWLASLWISFFLRLDSSQPRRAQVSRWPLERYREVCYPVE